MIHRNAAYMKHPAYLARVTPPQLPSGISRHQDPRKANDPRSKQELNQLRERETPRNSVTDRVRQYLENIAISGDVLPPIPNIALHLGVAIQPVHAALGNLRTYNLIRTMSRQRGHNMPADWICEIVVNGEVKLMRSIGAQDLSFDTPTATIAVTSRTQRVLVMLEKHPSTQPLPTSERINAITGVSIKRIPEVYTILEKAKKISVERQRPFNGAPYEYRIVVLSSGKELRTRGWED